MVKTWGSEDGSNRACECGAIYEVSYRRFPMKDSDYFDCDICGKRLDKWKSTTVPIYRLIQEPK